VRGITDPSQSATSFEIKVQRADSGPAAAPAVPVSYAVFEAGIYNETHHGVKFEALQFQTRNVTDGTADWQGRDEPMANNYDSPVVLGQVQSHEDADFSVFWSRGATRFDPPGPDGMRVGKHIGNDSDTNRAPEIGGYVILEAGETPFGRETWVAGVTGEAVHGVDDSPPYAASLGGAYAPGTALVSQTGMNDGDGGWGILYGPNPVTASALAVAIDEDRMADPERNHGAEQIAFLMFAGNAPVFHAPVASHEIVAGSTLLLLVDAEDAESDSSIVLELTSDTPAANPALLVDHGSGDGEITWTPGPSDTGIYALTLTADNGHGEVATLVITVTVTANASPTVDPIADQTLIEGETLTLAVNALDPDGPPPIVLSQSNDLPNAPEVLSDNGDGTGTIEWTPTNGDTGTYAIDVTATDGFGNTATATIDVTVHANAAPTINPVADQTLTEGDLLTVNVTASDPDGPAPPVLAQSSNLPGAVAVLVDNGDGTGSLTWQSVVGDVGTFAVTLTATDGFGHEGSVVFSVSVDPAN
jgi:hypothetical protein